MPVLHIGVAKSYDKDRNFSKFKTKKFLQIDRKKKRKN